MRVDVFPAGGGCAYLEDGDDHVHYRLMVSPWNGRPNGEPIFDVQRLGGGARKFDAMWWDRVHPTKRVLADLRRVLPTVHAYRQSKVVLRSRDLVYVALATEPYP